jgi:SAM-dependent methyltransferase/uncharacterized protein YbaR (Trm112 family)
MVGLFLGELCCPNCRGGLATNASGIRCLGCDQQYEIRFGIPDLRWPPATPDGRALALAAELLKHYDRSTFGELAAFAVESLPAPDDLKAEYLTYRARAIQRGESFERMFRAKLAENFRLPATGLAMDIGCGSGASLPAIARDFDRVCGVDPYLPDLVLARKLCDEQGIANVLLVQGVAERLPFKDGIFDYVRGQNVLEHLPDVEQALIELKRVLKRGGCFCGDSRNRFDLLLPEPHVKLRWVGFLPHRWRQRYVRAVRRIDYQGVFLLSLADLCRVFGNVFADNFVVTLSDPSVYGYSSRYDQIIAQFTKYRALSKLLAWFFPSHLVLAQVR